MGTFRFGILGAAGIASHFCIAVSQIEDCEVCAVASKSLERAEKFAATNGVPKYYDSYEELLETEKPDAAYIAVTTNDHYRLSKMCVERGIPVLCEKAMFESSEQARDLFALAKEKQVFVMEALWSRFLPAVNKVKSWVEEGVIGIPQLSQFTIGFIAPENVENRYYSPALGGGAARDITVYAYELTTYILQQKIKRMNVSATFAETGVDINNHISIDFEHTLADLTTSFVTNVDNKMVLYGRYGKIVLPYPHFASECFWYDTNGELKEHFKDAQSRSGYVYEIEETIRCVREGKIESDVVPWSETLECAKLFDEIAKVATNGIK